MMNYALLFVRQKNFLPLDPTNLLPRVETDISDFSTSFLLLRIVDSLQLPLPLVKDTFVP